MHEDIRAILHPPEPAPTNVVQFPTPPTPAAPEPESEGFDPRGGIWLDTVDDVPDVAVVPRLLYAGKVTCINGRAGKGKTPLVAQLMAALTTGVDPFRPEVLGPLDPDGNRLTRRVGWIGEETPTEVLRRIVQFDGDPGMVCMRRPAEFEARMHLTAWLRTLRLHALVVSPMMDLLRPDPGEEHSYSRIRQLIDRWLIGHAVAVLLINHQPKDGPARDTISVYSGSHGIEGMVDLMVDMEHGEGAAERRDLAQTPAHAADREVPDRRGVTRDYDSSGHGGRPVREDDGEGRQPDEGTGRHRGEGARVEGGRIQHEQGGRDSGHRQGFRQREIRGVEAWISVGGAGGADWWCST